MTSTWHPTGSKLQSAPSQLASGPDARTVWRTLLAIAGPPLALYVAIARFLLPYDMSDSPEMIFEKLVAHPGFGMVDASGSAWSWLPPASRAWSRSAG